MSQPKQPQVLIVDDDAVVLERLRSLAEGAGYATYASHSGRDALEQLGSQSFDAVLLDIQLPDCSGLDVLREVRAVQPELPVILVTGHASLEGAIEAIRGQAYDYLVKPVSPDDLRMALSRAIRVRELERENHRLRELVDAERGLPGLVTKSPAMVEVASLLRRLRDNQSPVLIRGESGTGKDVVARAIHLESARKQGPFVAINCAAIPESLLESELFGHAKGAFSGAQRKREGLFVQADRGTLFLDEIGEMAPNLQSKLLRVVQDQEVRPVGSDESVRCDVRIVSATNQDLASAIAEGRFREDLFYRLNVIPIELPPLRERPEDIAPLASLFLERQGGGHRLDASAIRRLEEHDWPGNIRELANVIERSTALCDGKSLGESDLLFESVRAQRPSTTSDQATVDELCRDWADERLALREVEDRYIAEVLRRSDGNKAEAARILGINRTTLYRRSKT